MALVAVSEFKTALRVPSAETAYDAEITQLIERVQARIEGACLRKFEKQTYTAEVHDGNDTPRLMLDNYPLRLLTSVAIEDESAITPLDADQIRYDTSASSPAILELQQRLWTRGHRNVTVTYDAGFALASIKIEAGDLWELTLDCALQLWQDMLNRRRGVASQSQMDGSITYYDPVMTLSEAFRVTRWNPVIAKYRRQRRIGTTAGPQPISIGFFGVRA